MNAVAPIGAWSSPPVRTICVTGGKGGTGKTCIAINLAIAMSRRGRRVLLLDGDLTVGNVDCLLNLPVGSTLKDVLAGDACLQDVLIPGPGGISVVPGAQGALEMARLSQFEHATLIRLFSDLTVDADTLIVDSAPGLSDTSLSLAGATREVIVVVCDEPASIQEALGTIAMLQHQYRMNRYHVLANQTESSSHGRELFTRVLARLGPQVDVVLEYAGCIPMDVHVRQAVVRHEALIEAFPGSPAARAIERLATRAERWPTPDLPRGPVEFFVERLVQAACGFR